MAVKILTRMISRWPKATPNQILTFPYQKSQYISTKSDSVFPIHLNLPSHQSKFTKQISLSNLFQRYGLSSPQLKVLTTNGFLLNSSIHDMEHSLGILLSFKIPHTYMVKLLCNCPGVLDVQFLKKWEIGFSELGLTSAPPLMVCNILEHSRRFQVDPGKYFLIVSILKGIGLSDGTVTRVLEDYSEVVMMNHNDISLRIKFLMGIGIPRAGIDHVICSYPQVLGFQVNDRLKLLRYEFEQLGFSKNVIAKEVSVEPRILGLELGELSRCLELLTTLKCRVPIKEKIIREGSFRAGFGVKLRVDCLCKHGLIVREAFKVLWKEPRLITYEIEDIERKIEFLVQNMKFRVDCLVEVPEYLGVSLEKQIVPRFNVVEYLRSKGAFVGELGLKEIIKPSRLRFYNLFVKPYPECEKMFGRLSTDAEVARHPVGLWKLFRPQRFAESKDDIKNMKSFVESLA